MDPAAVATTTQAQVSFLQHVSDKYGFIGLLIILVLWLVYLMFNSWQKSRDQRIILAFLGNNTKALVELTTIVKERLPRVSLSRRKPRKSKPRRV